MGVRKRQSRDSKKPIRKWAVYGVDRKTLETIKAEYFSRDNREASIQAKSDGILISEIRPLEISEEERHTLDGYPGFSYLPARAY